VDLGLEFDRVVINAILEGQNLYDIGAVMSHRLGELIKHMPDHTVALIALMNITMKRANDQDKKDD
jgi:hypothetical protein